MVFQFKVKIKGLSHPPVWRKVEVPSSFTFQQFHQVIQIIFGWGNVHLWNFAPRTNSYSRQPAFRIEEPNDYSVDWIETESLDAWEITLDKIFPSNKEMVYTYDYGDFWEHSITLEGIIDENRECAVCVKGKGTTPPEDCGGVFGYEALKNAFANQDKKAMATYREWLCIEKDESWDPNFFCANELTDINTDLRGMVAPIIKNRQTATTPFSSKYDFQPGYYSIQELLNSKTVPQLRAMALLLSFRFKSGIKKAMMLDCIAERMLEKPETLLKSAFYYELKAFLDIINGNMTLEYATNSGPLFELNRFGLIYALKYSKDNSTTLHFQMDLADILAPLIPAELERRERNGSLLFEKLALGCANIYGYTQFYFLHDYIKEVEKRVGCKYDDDTLTEAFYPVLCELSCGTKNEKDLLSPFAEFTGFIPDEEHIRYEIAAKVFDFDTILKYGEMPYPQFPGKKADALRNLISKHGTSGSNPDEILRRIWINHQKIGANPLQNLDFIGHPDKPLSQSSLDTIVDFNNNVPCWLLRGNSSQEIFDREKGTTNSRTPKITMGPNMQAMGINSFEQLMEMARNDEDFFPRPIQTTAKVGRNDPCPCGSGKKYKHCCGRNR